MSGYVVIYCGLKALAIKVNSICNYKWLDIYLSRMALKQGFDFVLKSQREDGSWYG